MGKQVVNKWKTDGDLAVIYRVDDLLLFYTTDKDPKFEHQQTLTLDEAIESKPYKSILYSEDKIPSDAYVDFGWVVQ